MYTLSAVGEEAIQPVKPPSMLVPALSLMGVALIPWLPVAGGVWLGKKYGRKTRDMVIGGAAGFGVSLAGMWLSLRKFQNS